MNKKLIMKVDMKWLKFQMKCYNLDDEEFRWCFRIDKKLWRIRNAFKVLMIIFEIKEGFIKVNLLILIIHFIN